eukprot:923565-Ditylum_brightwellii.AAC.1
MEYLTREEFRGRVQPMRKGDVNDSLADDSLLVSPVLADYIGNVSCTDKVSSTGDESNEHNSANDNELTSPERINLGDDLQLDASYISLGLGSLKSVETSAQEVDLNESCCEPCEKGTVEEWCKVNQLTSPTSAKKMF